MPKSVSASSRIQSLLQRYRVALGVVGVAAIVAGLFILIWPSAVLNLITIAVAVYAIVAGCIYLGLGLFSDSSVGGAKALRIALGVLFVVLGVLALVFLGTASNIALWTIAVITGVLWITEGAVTLLILLQARNASGWGIFYAIAAVIVGVLVILSPLWGATLMRWLFGLSFIGLGAAQLVRASTLGNVEVTAEVVVENKE